LLPMLPLLPPLWLSLLRMPKNKINEAAGALG
jgi:hypothetical protein